MKIQDFLEARPDILAHSAANIISRLKSGGENISEALKVLCLRQKGIHVEVMYYLISSSFYCLSRMGPEVVSCAVIQTYSLGQEMSY